MVAYLDEQKRKIAAYLAGALGRVDDHLAAVADRLLEYTARGKMIRGGLAVLGCDLFADPREAAIIPVSAALELIQSALLIHDDIMDRDELRRGEVTLHRAYAREAAARSPADADHVGDALATCAGDIAFFMAFQMVTEADLAPGRTGRIVSLVARELQLTGAAQMKDVWLGAAPPDAEAPPEEEIIDLYRYKTARYSFSLPLTAGALAAGAGDKALAALDRLGEHLGIIFQIKDDELGLFGDEVKTGKPIGSDLREGKKTVMSGRLRGKIRGADRERFDRLFGNREIGVDDVAFVRDLVERTGVRREMDDLVGEYARRCRDDLSRLTGARREKVGWLERLLAYSIFRKW